MFKKRIMLLSLLTLFSLGILASCGENNCLEIHMPYDYEKNTNIQYYDWINIGLRTKSKSNDLLDVDLYYGMNPYLSNKINFFDEEYSKYSDYNQIIDFRILRYYRFLKSDYEFADDWLIINEKEIHSFSIKLGDFFTNNKYIFNINNKVVDTLDFDYFNDEYTKGRKQIIYRAEIKSQNGEYIKYVCSPQSSDSNSYNPIVSSIPYTDVTNIGSNHIGLSVYLNNQNKSILLNETDYSEWLLNY